MTKTLNEIFNKLDTETQKVLADMFQKAEKQSEMYTENVYGKFSSSNKQTRQDEKNNIAILMSMRNGNLQKTTRMKTITILRIKK